MVEVLQQPPRNNWEIKLLCDGCKALLKAKIDDVNMDTTDYREPPWYYIVCPLCLKKNTIKKPSCL